MTSELALPITRRLWPRLQLVLLVMAVIGAVLLTGCRTSPVKDLTKVPISASGASMTEISKSIQSAGNGLGWVMQEKYPGLIIGTLHLRDHMAQVEIPYSTTSYSILYKSSSNLKYNASNRTIHSNYNSWISNLDNQIRARLSML
jgi:uncharacterized lipoprotein YmbA